MRRQNNPYECETETEPSSQATKDRSHFFAMVGLLSGVLCAEWFLVLTSMFIVYPLISIAVIAFHRIVGITNASSTLVLTLAILVLQAGPIAAMFFDELVAFYNVPFMVVRRLQGW